MDRLSEKLGSLTALARALAQAAPVEALLAALELPMGAPGGGRAGVLLAVRRGVVTRHAFGDAPWQGAVRAWAAVAPAGLVEQLAAARSAVRAPGEGVPPELGALAGAEGGPSIWIAPVRGRGRAPDGILVIGFERAADSDADRAAWVEGVASLLEVAVELGRAAQARSLASVEALGPGTTLRAVLDAVSDGVGVIDASGKLAYWNPHIETLLRAVPVPGEGAEERARTYGIFLADQTTLCPASALPGMRALRGERVDGAELFLRHTTGPPAWIRVDARPLFDADGRIIGAVAVSRDVTREKSERERLAVSERLVSVGMVAAGVAHEVNNPLTVVLANLDLAMRAASEGPSTEASEVLSTALRDAREAAERVRHIAMDLRTLSRADDDARAPVDLHGTLDTALRLARHEMAARAHVVVSYGETPPLRGNAARLGQVLLNLLVNAAQAIGAGHVDANVIEVTVGTTDGMAFIDVRDTGGGIPAAVRARLFTPFATTKAGGTGLGLAICDQIVRAHGGRIVVDSEPGRGTTFRVLLPAAEVGPPREPPPDLAKGAPPAPRVRVLVVDDDELTARAIRRTLAPAHDVTVVRSALHALDAIARGERYDVLLSDLDMPGLGGVGLHERLRAIAPELAARTVLMTGGMLGDDVAAYVERAGCAVLEKPFGAEQVRAAIRARVR